MLVGAGLAPDFAELIDFIKRDIRASGMDFLFFSLI
jgi:hypothetical protein